MPFIMYSCYLLSFQFCFPYRIGLQMWVVSHSTLLSYPIVPSFFHFYSSTLFPLIIFNPSSLHSIFLRSLAVVSPDWLPVFYKEDWSFLYADLHSKAPFLQMSYGNCSLSFEVDASNATFAWSTTNLTIIVHLFDVPKIYSTVPVVEVLWRH